jgi:hypothetical protein
MEKTVVDEESVLFPKKFDRAAREREESKEV